MLLKQLTLENIRSYQHQTINFPEGSTLLSGDIGSGKSSILLATEFALFGASRTELSAESLLRKGATSASVELSLVLDGKDVTIKRTLKKDGKGTIKQANGYVVINQQKKELTPVELKAEMINMIGYPDDLVSKGKNYVFRYTVYCPQEEMKLILQENPENRLDILRKIFNIERYKNIRDNLQGYLRKFRKELTVMETRIEPISQTEVKLQELKTEIELLDKKLGEVVPKKEELVRRIKLLKEELNVHEDKNKQWQDLKSKLGQEERLLQELREGFDVNVGKSRKVDIQLKELLLDQKLDKDSIKKEIVKLENEKTSFLQEKTRLQERINGCQDKIVYLQKEIKSFVVDGELKQKEKLLLELKEVVSKKEEILGKQERVVKLDEKTKELITKNLTLQREAQKLIERISQLEQCPTCQQELSFDYKENISLKENEKIVASDKILEDLREKEKSILVQKEEIFVELEKINRSESERSKVELEIKHFKDQEGRLLEKKEELRKFAQENNQLMQTFRKFQQDSEFNLERINKRLEQLQELREKILLREELEKQSQELRFESGKLQEKIDLCGKVLSEIKICLDKFPGQEELVKIISEKKEQLEILLRDEKELSLQETQLNTSKMHLQKEQLNVKQELERLVLEKSKLISQKELYRWLSSYFLPLTYTIEKEILGKIYYHFNQLFQEWFEILVEDNEIYSRLDDSFTPIIEQNNYEISFNHLSGGERTAVSLAYRLALNKVINDVIHQIKTKDLLILDEPTDGFSSEQLDKVRDLIDRLDLKQIILVSHESKIESFVNNLIRIEKLDHSSQVVG